MKRSVLLISLLCILGFITTAQEIPRVAKPKAAVKAKAPQKAAAAKSSKKKVKKKIVKKKAQQRVIIHTAPDQQKIDSIKNEKMKYKK